MALPEQNIREINAVDQPASRPKTPYEIAGGADVVEAIVARFYELMDTESAYADLRAIHAEDLGPVQKGLTQFLKAWMGGPKDWFDQGKCVMSLHRAFPISCAIGQQWSDAMQRAISDQKEMNSDLAQAMSERLSQMAKAMVNQQAS